MMKNPIDIHEEIGFITENHLKIQKEFIMISQK